MLQSEEKIWIQKLQAGEKEAFHIIYKTYYKRVYSFCFKLFPSNTECEEIVQNVFIAIWEQREKIDENRVFSTFIFGIAKYTVYQAFRNHVIRSATFEYYINSEQELSTVTEDEIQFSELKEKMDQLIEQLPLKRRIIFRLSRFYGLTYQQIANKLQLSENTVDTQIRKSLQFLRLTYKKLFDY